MNTAHSTSAIAISGAADLVHAVDARRLARRVAGRDVALDVLHHDDGVVDHDADRQHQAEQREVVEREAEQAHHEERADQRDRDGDDRYDGGAPGLQEQDDHQHHQDHGLEDGLDHRLHRLLDELGRIVDDGVLKPGREALGDVRIGAILSPVVSALEPGRWNTASTTRDVAVEIGVRCRSPGRSARRVRRPQRTTALAVCLITMLPNSSGSRQAPERAHRDLEGELVRHRRLVEHARGDLHVLALQRRGDVERGQIRATAAGRDRARPASRSRGRRRW